MGVLAWVFGVIGWLCTAMGVVTALAVVPEVAELTWTFWLVLATILFLITIACLLGRSSSYE